MRKLMTHHELKPTGNRVPLGQQRVEGTVKLNRGHRRRRKPTDQYSNGGKNEVFGRITIRKPMELTEKERAEFAEWLRAYADRIEAGDCADLGNKHRATWWARKRDSNGRDSYSHRRNIR